MRILMISLNAWNETMSTGNTFSNFIGELSENDDIASIYCRNEPIGNSICKRYFRITEYDIISNIIKLSGCGVELCFEQKKCNSKESKSILSTTSPIGAILRKKRPALLLFLRELIWNLGTWKGEKLDKFLASFKPDVIYMHCHYNWYMHSLLWYCQKKTKAKVVLFSGDDLYAHNKGSLLSKIYHKKCIAKINHSFLNADLVFGGSVELCKEFGEKLGISIRPLYKTCTNLHKPCFKEFSLPLQMVYSGNLLFGRDDVLIEMSKQISIINKQKLRLQLHIYTNTQLDANMRRYLNDGVNCFYEGARPYNEIKEILDDCDFALFAESLKDDAKSLTRLSFSTKIIDYFQANSCLIVVGPKDIASVSYLEKSKVCIMIDDLDCFEKKFEQVFSDLNVINDMILRKYDYALQHHSKPSLLQTIKNELSIN